MNILFIHEVDWENKVVFDIHSLSELLASFGHKIFLIDFPAFKKGRQIDKLITLRTNEFEVKGRSRSDVSITIIRPGIIQAPIFDRISAFFTHYISIEHVIKKNHIDAIVLYSVPTNGFQVIKLAKRNNIPVIFRSIDILYQLVPSKIYSAPTFSLETFVYKNSDRIMALSPLLSEYVKRMKAPCEKVDLLLFGVDFTKFNPSINSDYLREKIGIAKDDFVILFVGTLFEFSGLDQYMEQFPKVVEKLPNARLLIVGGGALLNRLKRRSFELGLSKNVFFTGFQPFHLMPVFINMADVCINPFRLTGATREIIPGKILQYLACAKPVLATPLPGMTSQIKGYNNGLLYCPIEEFADRTIMLLEDPKLLKKIGLNGYLYAKKNHDEIELARKLENVLYDEVKKKRS